MRCWKLLLDGFGTLEFSCAANSQPIPLRGRSRSLIALLFLLAFRKCEHGLHETYLSRVLWLLGHSLIPGGLHAACQTNFCSHDSAGPIDNKIRLVLHLRSDDKSRAYQDRENCPLLFLHLSYTAATVSAITTTHAISLLPAVCNCPAAD